MGKKSIVEGSIWESERRRVRARETEGERPLGLLHGWKLHFHHVSESAVTQAIFESAWPGEFPCHPKCWGKPYCCKWTEVMPWVLKRKQRVSLCPEIGPEISHRFPTLCPEIYYENLSVCQPSSLEAHTLFHSAQFQFLQGFLFTCIRPPSLQDFAAYILLQESKGKKTGVKVRELKPQLGEAWLSKFLGFGTRCDLRWPLSAVVLSWASVPRPEIEAGSWQWEHKINTKCCTTWELWVFVCFLFLLGGRDEDCSPGDSTPDSSEKLLQRGRKGRSIYVILVKEEFTQSSTYPTKGFLLVARSWRHHEGI